MLKLMIVDDENLFREALKISLPWKQLGYEVCCEAENGYDALERIAEFKPDVALVDINMPVMDGLELAAEIRENGLDVKVIIISGYGEFTYARQAIEVGVVNYLLKPVDEEELIKALSAIRKAIEKERSTGYEMEGLLRQANAFRPLLKEMLLNDLMQGSRCISGDDLPALGLQLEPDVHSRLFQVAVIELDEKAEYGWNAETRQAWGFAVSDIAAGLLTDCGCRHEISHGYQGRLNVLLFPDAHDQDNQLELIGAFDRIRLTVSKSLGFTVTTGMGRPYESIGQVSMSYKEALYALNNRLAIEENSVLYYPVAAEYRPGGNIFPIEQKMQLHMCLRIRNFSEAEKIITSVLAEIRQNNPSIEMAKFICSELVSSVLQTAIEAGRAGGFFDLCLTAFQQIQTKTNLNEMETLIMKLLPQLSGDDPGKSKRMSRIVESAKDYIGQNYSRFDLKIDEIAKHIFVQYGHLCFVFKRETGKTINEYISDFRISKAKELIDGGCLSVSMVAAKVGYADANYFSKCFKKLAGVTPGKYMELSQPGKA